METSVVLEIVVGGVGVVSFETEVCLVVLEYLPLYTGADDVDGVFDGSLGDLITVSESFYILNCDIAMVFAIFQLFLT